MKKGCSILFIVICIYSLPVYCQPVGNTITMSANTDHIAVPDNGAWDLVGDFTLSVKVKFTSYNWQMLLTHHDGINTQGFEFSYTGTAIQLSPEGYTVCINKPWVAVLNTWYTLSITRQGDVFTVFVDGVSIGTNTHAGAIGTDDFPLMIGNYYYPGYQFIGEMDDVSIWNTAVTAVQMQNIAAGTLNGNETGLVAYYTMNRSGQGAGLIVTNMATSGSVFDGVTVGSATTPYFNVVLPVNFISIDANYIATGIKINWKVAGESGMSRYAVERSTDGSNFITVGSVAAASNSSIEKNYSWLDNTVFTGTVFYRVKGIGVLGEIKYTGTVKININSSKSGFSVSPNPATSGIVNLQFKNQPVGKYITRLLSSTGQLLLSNTITHSGGNSNQMLYLPSDILTGTYLLEIITPDKTIIIQKLFVR